MSLFSKVLGYAPWAYVAIFTFFVPIEPAWLHFAILAVWTALGFLQREIFLSSGNIRTRKRFELAFCGLIALSLLGTLNDHLAFWPLLPFFLYLVWIDFTPIQLYVLTTIFAAISFSGFAPQVSWDRLSLLYLTVTFAVLFRLSESQKKKILERKLESFENFEKKISEGVQGPAPNAHHIQARSESKVGELLLEQSKRFSHFAEMIESVFFAHSVLIYTFDPIREEFVLQTFRSRSDQVDDSPQPMTGIFVALKSQGEVHFHSEAGIQQLPYYLRTPKISALLAVPIYRKNLLIGVVLIDREKEKFSKADLVNLKNMAITIGDCIQDTETIYSYFRLKEELASFYAASSCLNQAFRLRDVFEIFLKTAHDIAPVDVAYLIMRDSSGKQNTVVAQFGPTDNFIGETFALSPSKGLASWVIANNKPLSYDGYRRRHEHSPVFHRRMKLPNIYQSVCLFPLAVKEEILGAVVFLSQKDGFFSVSTRKILEVLSLQASIAIKNAKMVRDLEQLATTDGLTGLINHRTFQKQLIHEIERSRRSGNPVSLMLVDLDHFKQINDNYGHPFGDFVLKEIALFLRSSVRNVDYVARYGGEEFAIIFPNTTGDETMMMANRMVQTIRKKTLKDQGVSIHVTFSVGISTYPNDALAKEQLIDFADTALYFSKKTGRNRATRYAKDLKMVDFTDKEHRLIQRAEKILREQ